MLELATKRNSTSKFSFIDLFAGIGGFRIGLERLGGEAVFTSEYDKFAQMTYKHWFDESEIFGDITQLDSDIKIATTIPDHDVLAAGFPCQPFSLAGVSKKISLGRKHGFDDVKQGNLFHYIADILRVKRPAIAILENVKNLASHDSGRTWETIQRILDELGYVVFSSIIDGKHWVPQHRERLLIVCFDKDHFGADIPFRFPTLAAGLGPSVKDILETSPDSKYTLSNHLWQYLQDYAAKHREAGNGFGFGVADLDGISRTLSARYHKDGSEILIPQKNQNPRRLTPMEALRLMGFDEIITTRSKGIIVSDTQAYRQFGNAVIPDVVEFAARNAIKILLEYKSARKGPNSSQYKKVVAA